MVYIGTPEQYFQQDKLIVIPQPVETKVVEPINARVVVEPTQTVQTDTPLVLAICFLGIVSIGLVIVIGIHMLGR